MRQNPVFLLENIVRSHEFTAFHTEKYDDKAVHLQPCSIKEEVQNMAVSYKKSAELFWFC